jgi:hypothetical protein
MAICAYAAGIDMTQDEIIEMARQVGFKVSGELVLDDVGYVTIHHRLGDFAKLVAAKALSEQERNFCSRCGKRTADLTAIHTCTPPHD